MSDQADDKTWRAQVEWARKLRPLQLVRVRWLRAQPYGPPVMSWIVTVVERVDWDRWVVRLRSDNFSGQVDIGSSDLMPYEDG